MCTCILCSVHGDSAFTEHRRPAVKIYTAITQGWQTNKTVCYWQFHFSMCLLRQTAIHSFTVRWRVRIHGNCDIAWINCIQPFSTRDLFSIFRMWIIAELITIKVGNVFLWWWCQSVVLVNVTFAGNEQWMRCIKVHILWIINFMEFIIKLWKTNWRIDRIAYSVFPNTIHERSLGAHVFVIAWKLKSIQRDIHEMDYILSMMYAEIRTHQRLRNKNILFREETSNDFRLSIPFVVDFSAKSF